MRTTGYTFVFFSLCITQLCGYSEGRPLRKRTVSEVQLMHDLGEHQQVQERREWLQMRLRGIHTAAVAAAGPGPGAAPVHGAETTRSRRRLRAEELPDLTPEEIQYALAFLEKLLKSKQS